MFKGDAYQGHFGILVLAFEERVSPLLFFLFLFFSLESSGSIIEILASRRYGLIFLMATAMGTTKSFETLVWHLHL